MSDVDYLYEPRGSQLHWDGLRDINPNPIAAILESQGAKPLAPARHPQERQGMQGTRPSDAHPAPRKVTPEDLLAQARDMLKTQQAQHEGNLGNGPAVHQREDGELPEWLKNYEDGG